MGLQTPDFVPSVWLKPRSFQGLHPLDTHQEPSLVSKPHPFGALQQVTATSNLTGNFHILVYAPRQQDFFVCALQFCKCILQSSI